MFTVHADKALATVVHMDSNNVLRVPWGQELLGVWFCSFWRSRNRNIVNASWGWCVLTA